MKIMKAGNRIVLDEQGSYIEQKASGKQIKIRTDRDEFEFEIWVPKAKSGEEPVKGKKNKVNFESKNQFQALSMDVDSDGDAMLEMVFTRQV